MNHGPPTIRWWSPSDRRPAFAIKELLIVVAVLAVLAGLWRLKAVHRGRHVDEDICAQCLRHIGLSFQLWSQEHGGLYPMQSESSLPGVPMFQMESNPCVYFQMMAEELHAPGILTCPADRSRKCATDFTSDLDRSHISYFVGLDAFQKSPTVLLAGDRNLSTGPAAQSGVLDTAANPSVAWTSEIHGHAGNVVFGDGSVRMLNNRRLKKAFAAASMVTNRLALP